MVLVANNCRYIRSINSNHLKTTSWISFISKRSASNQSPTINKDYSPQKHCTEHVRKYDYENYIPSLLIKSSLTRRTAFAVRALSIELAQVTDMARNVEIAAMRYQWWSEMIDDLYQDRDTRRYRGQPIAYELQHCLWNAKGVTRKGPPMSKMWLKRLVDSRLGVLKRSSQNQLPFSNVEEMQSYADFSCGSIYYLLSEQVLAENSGVGMADVDERKDTDLDVDRTKTQKVHQDIRNLHLTLDHIGSHIGKAQGIANLIRGLEINARKFNTCFVPQDILLKHSVSQEDILRWNPEGEARNKIRDICYDMATTGYQHLSTAKAIMKLHKFGDVYKEIFLPLITIDICYKHIEKKNFDPFELNKARARRDGLLPLKVWWRSKFL